MPAAKPDYAAQAELAQSDFFETIKRFEAEGFDARAVVAGMTGAFVTLIATLYGKAEVPRWFERTSAEAAKMLDRDS